MTHQEHHRLAITWLDETLRHVIEACDRSGNCEWFEGFADCSERLGVTPADWRQLVEAGPEPGEVGNMIQEERKPAAATAGFPDELGRLALFSEIVAHFAERAKSNGLDTSRVDRAIELVLHPEIHERCWAWDKSDGCETLNLRSQSDPGRWYRVNGACECTDYQRHGNGWFCKHRLARALIIRAEEYLGALADRGSEREERETALPVDWGRGRSKLFKSAHPALPQRAEAVA